MSKFTYFTLFGGAGIGTSRLRELGGECLGTIEHDLEQFEMWTKNYEIRWIGEPRDILTSPIPAQEVDILQASPPCVNFSGAKIKKNVTLADQEKDMALSLKIADYVDRMNPKLVIIENVPKYFKSEAFKQIRTKIESLGYNQSNYSTRFGWSYGLPIARERGFYVAWKGSERVYKQSSYKKAGSEGWYRHIQDCLTPETGGLTKWQNLALDNFKVSNNYSGLVIMSRVGMRKTANYVYELNAILPAIKASLADDGKGGRGRSKIWTVHNIQTGYNMNLEPRAFANLMGVERTFQISEIPRVALRSIGNGIVPAIINDLVEQFYE
jgi:site-specific DNA-cytosine methylase